MLAQNVLGEQLSLGQPVLKTNPLAYEPSAAPVRPGAPGATKLRFDGAADHRGRPLLSDGSAAERAHRATDDFV
jgi:hypothetical protein